MRTAFRHGASLLALSAVLLAACGGDDAGTASGDDAPDGIAGELVVFTAASLTDAFEELGAAFERRHPDVTVTFNYAGSQRLAGQIVEGAPADVFASANRTQMDVVVAEGLVAGEPTPFASNALAIAVEPGNPLGIERLADLAGADVTLVLAAEEVPIGVYTRAALAKADVTVTPSSLETDVRAVLSKVALGEADVAVVYSSDVVAAGDRVQRVPIPEEHNVPVTYPIAVLEDASNRRAARAFVDHVRSPEGRAALETSGFGAP